MIITKLVVDFFLLKNISRVVAFSCYGSNKYNFMKELSSSGFQSAVFDECSHEDTWTSLLNSSNTLKKQGGVIDLDCEGSNKVLSWGNTDLGTHLQFVSLIQDFVGEVDGGGRIDTIVIDFAKALDVITNDLLQQLGYQWLLLLRGDISLADVKHRASATPFMTSEESVVALANLTTTPVSLLKLLSLEEDIVADNAMQELFTWSDEDRMKATNVTDGLANLLRWTTLKTNSIVKDPENLNRLMFDQAILHLLQQLFNFSLEVVKSSRGHKSKDLWILKQLGMNQLDIGASTVLVTFDRMGLADYTFAIDMFTPQLYYKVQSLRAARNIYVLPFSVEVWVSLFSLLLAITVALTFILGSETRLPGSKSNQNYVSYQDTPIKDKFSEHNYLDSDQQPSWDLSEVMLVTFGALSQQGSDRDPNTSAARTLFVILFLLAVLMYTAYSASIISIMSSTRPVSNSLEEILEEGSKMGLALHNSHYYHTNFKDEPNPVSRSLQQLDVAPTFMSLEEGIQATLEGNIAYSSDREETYTYLHTSQQTEDTLCSVGEIPLLQGPGYQRAFALRKGSPYVHTLNKGLVKLIEHGLISREKKTSFSIQKLCHLTDVSTSSGFIRISIDDVSPALKLVGFGVLISMILLPIEILIKKCTSHIKAKFSSLYFNGPWEWPVIDNQKHEKFYTAERKAKIIKLTMSVWNGIRQYISSESPK